MAHGLDLEPDIAAKVQVSVETNKLGHSEHTLA